MPMSEKKVQQKTFLTRKYVVAKTLRLSIALIIILALFFIIFSVIELGKRVEPGILFGLGSIILVILLLVIPVIALIVLFSHRLMGPVRRLTMEMDQIKSGNYHKRLRLRKKDDSHLKAFILKVNKALEEFDRVRLSKKEILKNIDAELSKTVSISEGGEALKEKQREALLSVHKKVKSMLEEKYQ